MRIGAAAIACVMLACSACSGERQSASVVEAATPAQQMNALAEENVAAGVKARLGFLPWITGSFAAGDTASTFVAFLDGEVPVAIFETQDLGDYGENRVAHYYSDGRLIAFEKRSRQLSAAGAPSDGWYESETLIEFADGRFLRGRKTVNGKPSEPDEHEVRGAGRTGAELRARVVAILAGAAPARAAEAGAQLVVHGTLDAGEDVSLPEGAIARLQIRDVSKQDVAAEIIASKDRPIDRLPAPFALTAPRSAVSPRAELAIFAQIVAGERLLYITASRTPAEPQDPSGSVTARLTKVSAPQESAPGTGAGAMMITPPQDLHDCGGERLLIAVEAGGAFVTFADRSTLLLPLLSADAAAAEKIFTDGAATLVVEAAGERRVRFARGRAALLDCSKG